MKFKILILLLTILPFIGYSQTEQLEKENFKNKIMEEGSYSSAELMEIGKKWNDLMDKHDGYPILPYDSISNDLIYEGVYGFDELNNEIIFNRIIEWASIAVDNPDNVIKYQNKETGKIILKGTISIDYAYDYTNFWGIDKEKKNYAKCSLAIVCTVSNNKLKVVIRDLRFIYYNSYVGLYGYSHIDLFEKPVSLLYPITNYPSDKWNEYLEVLIATNNNLLSLQKDLIAYIDGYFEDYDY